MMTTPPTLLASPSHAPSSNTIPNQSPMTSMNSESTRTHRLILQHNSPLKFTFSPASHDTIKIKNQYEHLTSLLETINGYKTLAYISMTLGCMGCMALYLCDRDPSSCPIPPRVWSVVSAILFTSGVECFRRTYVHSVRLFQSM